MRVLAIDPGEKVGYAAALVHDMAEGQRSIEVTSHGIALLKDFAVQLHSVISQYDVVIYEDYRIAPSKLRAHTGSNVPTLQLVGMIRLCAWLNPQVKLVCQQPAQQGRGTDKILAANPEVFGRVNEIIRKAPAAHDESHDVSALKHLSFWFWNTYL